MTQFYKIFFIIGLVRIAYSTDSIIYRTRHKILADNIFETKVSSMNENETLPEGNTVSFKDWCKPVASRSRFVIERKICQSYPIINFNRCRIPALIYMTGCCVRNVMNKSLECREVYNNVQVLKSDCSSNDVKDYHPSNIKIPVACICIVPRSNPEAPI